MKEWCNLSKYVNVTLVLIAIMGAFVLLLELDLLPILPIENGKMLLIALSIGMIVASFMGLSAMQIQKKALCPIGDEQND